MSDIQFDFRKEDAAKATRAVLIVGGLIALLYVTARSVYTVGPSEQAVLMRFGKYAATSEPGLHFRIPFVDTVLTADM